MNVINVGFYTAFARWLPSRFMDLPAVLKDDFVLELIGLWGAFGPILDTFPEKRTIGTVLTWLFTIRDPLAPVRERIRAFKTKWAA